MLNLNDRTVDVIVFGLANLVNLLIAGLFLARVRGMTQVEYILGLVVVAVAIPVGLAALFNLHEHREWWTIALLIPLVLFCILELVLDYVLKLDFRNTALLWPYLALFYLAVLALIGYSFSLGKSYGFVTLGTYFLSLLATWYAHAS